MSDSYGSAYKSILEFPVQNDPSAEGDYIAVYDNSSSMMKRIQALSGFLKPTQINAGSTVGLTTAQLGSMVNLNTITGSTATLPTATGSMGLFMFRVSALATSNSHVISAGTAGKFQGFVFSKDDTSDNAVSFFAVSGTSNRITLNRTTTGSVTLGETIIAIDIATNLWLVLGFISNTGTPATPFSAV
jgi:hypothetical protein